jgi:hypothetical protein
MDAQKKLSGLIPTRRGKKQRVFTGDSNFTARKATLIQKLLNRHQRIDDSDAPLHDDSDSASDGQRANRIKAAVSSNPLKKLVTRGLRRKDAVGTVVARSRPTSPNLPIQEIKIPSAISDPNALSPITPDASSPEPFFLEKKARSFTPLHPSPEKRNKEYKDVIELAISTDLHPYLDAEDPYDTPRHISTASQSLVMSKARPWVVGSSIGVAATCSMCIFLLHFAWLPCIAGLVTVVLALGFIRQDEKLASIKILSDRNQVSKRERDAWSMANSHLRSRAFAARAYLSRAKSVEQSLSDFLQSHSRLHTEYIMEDLIDLAKRREHAVRAIESQIRSQVLLIASKAILLSNKRSKHLVLNSLGIEVMLSRLGKVQGITFDSDDFHQLLEQYGHTQQAVVKLYQLLSESGPLVQYHPLSIRRKK